MVGAYVGVATVGVFVAWYLCPTFMGIDLSADGHTPVTLWQLRHWETCAAWDGFKARARAAAPARAVAPVRGLGSGWGCSSEGAAGHALAVAVGAAAGAVALDAAAGGRDQCRCRRSLHALPAVLLGPAGEQGTVSVRYCVRSGTHAAVFQEVDVHRGFLARAPAATAALTLSFVFRPLFQDEVQDEVQGCRGCQGCC